ncbi:MAG: peptidoglycan DD-metalloendopeptidase family protein [Myxococcota bacterium]|nr:peptidoglycan DD-metalloendopeptidase family protein [Myxococcota bacterium]
MSGRAARGAPGGPRTGRAALVALLVALGSGPASADRSDDLEALRVAIEESRERVGAYERRERGLLEAVEALDRAFLLLHREVTEAREAADTARQALAEIEADAEGIRERLATTRRAMAARAVALYRAGELGAVRLVFSSEGLPEFLARVSSLRRLLALDAELLARHRAESEALVKAEADTRASAERLVRAESELAERSAELEVERERKRRLMARVHADRARERGALVELEKAARALEETLASLGEADDAGADRLAGPPFIALRRRLRPPVAAPVIVRFGRRVDERYLTETFHSGLVFGAPAGMPVRAVASGQVRFAGWFRGYGRLAILDHGGGYFTVSGHLDELGVAVGDAVARGEPIGTVGETGSLAGPRLYFEIRKGGEPLDPADWLRPPAAG